jgi:hypothetical protein
MALALISLYAPFLHCFSSSRCFFVQFCVPLSACIFFFPIRNGHGACSIKLQSIPHVHMAVKSGNGSHIHFPIGTILCYLCAVQSTQTKGRKFNLTFGSDCKELMQKTQSESIWSLSSSSSSLSSSNCQRAYWLILPLIVQLYYQLLCLDSWSSW